PAPLPWRGPDGHRAQPFPFRRTDRRVLLPRAGLRRFRGASSHRSVATCKTRGSPASLRAGTGGVRPQVCSSGRPRVSRPPQHTMASVVFMWFVSYGGHRAFRPAALARDLAKFEVVNVGAAGTFVVKK